MLTFEEFIEIIKNEIINHMDISFADANVSIQDVKKSNDVVYKGLIIRKHNETMCPTIYLEKFYENYKNGEGVDEIMDKISKMRVASEREEVPQIVQEIQDFEKIKDHIYPRIIGKREWNLDLLENRPYVLWARDLVMFFYIDIEEMENTASIAVTNKMLDDIWHIGIGELMDQAFHNFHAEKIERLIPTFKSMFQTLSEITSNENILGAIEDDELMFVLSNKGTMFGATSILDISLLNQIYEKIGDFYIIPSSIHEVLIVKKNNADPEDLNRMIREVNETQVDPTERLSDHIYQFDRESVIPVEE